MKEGGPFCCLFQCVLGVHRVDGLDHMRPGWRLIMAQPYGSSVKIRIRNRDRLIGHIWYLHVIMGILAAPPKLPPPEIRA